MGKKITIHTLQTMKENKQPITMLTAYDATFSRLFEQCDIDALLIGDSLGMVVQGHTNTLQVTIDEMIYHCRAVCRHIRHTHTIGDMPFMSYQVSNEEALRHAGRFIKEGGVEAVKIECGEEYAERAYRIVQAGIPVMGHVGLRPQMIHHMGGFVVQGRSSDDANRIKKDALAMQQAGCYALVLESIPQKLAKEITDALSIPTIGIGAGVHCDGQVLVCYDFLGLLPDFNPKFVKKYAQLADIIKEATQDYIKEVRTRQFPDLRHSFD